MKTFSKTISNCVECSNCKNHYLPDKDSGYSGAEFELYCEAENDSEKFLASSWNKSLVRNEKWTGRHNNILQIEVEIPHWCPLSFSKKPTEETVNEDVKRKMLEKTFEPIKPLDLDKPIFNKTTKGNK